MLATLATSRSNALKADGHATASALTSGYHLAFWVAAALVGCALVVVLAAIEPRRAHAAEHAHANPTEPARSSDQAATESAGA